ncbi:MAG: uroporphyrinogen decarboxylase [Cyclobacteriaceae bacterium]|nr:uroporphyrinogen decarboxylase [Cyclobacteriaceae bacterium]
MEIKNDLLLRAARGEKTERTPVWVMRQAGRILKEYREVRGKLSGFIALVQNPDLAAEVTIQPVDILGVDAAIIFSDILVIPEAMGLPYTMEEGKGPRFPQTVKNEADLARLNIASEDSLGYVIEAIKVTKRELHGRVPLIGFAGAPWTIFCYMVEGKGSKTFSLARKTLYNDPAFAHKLMDKITESTINYLKSQIAAGADIVQIFDSWAGILPNSQYEEFSLRYIARIADAITEVPVIVFAKGAYASRRAIGAINCNVVGLDWNMDIEESRHLVGTDKTLQGNLDPAVLYADFETVKSETRKMIDQFGTFRHIANLGHGVYPDMEADKVKCFIDEVKAYSSSRH